MQRIAGPMSMPIMLPTPILRGWQKISPSRVISEVSKSQVSFTNTVYAARWMTKPISSTMPLKWLLRTSTRTLPTTGVWPTTGTVSFAMISFPNQIAEFVHRDREARRNECRGVILLDDGRSGEAETDRQFVALEYQRVAQRAAEEDRARARGWV